MLLTVEFDKQDEVIDIFCDKEGLEFLQKRLSQLSRDGGHTHFLTPSWAGNELTEKKQNEKAELINHMNVTLISSK